MRIICVFILSISLYFFHSLVAAQENKKVTTKSPVVGVKTSLGTIEITLDAEKAPITVENFLSYVKNAFYDSTIFHRVIPGFMIQTGGVRADMTMKPIKEPIINEATNGLKNNRGTVAMGRTGEINSATSHFFINLEDNYWLNHKNDSPQGFGYAVFGKVTKGMDVVDKIGKVKTGMVKGSRNVPIEPVYIETIIVKE